MRYGLGKLCRTGIVGACGLLWLGLHPASATAQTWSLYDDYDLSYTIPFQTGPDYGPRGEKGITVELSVNGGPSGTYQVDTGSQGMSVPMADVPGYVAKGPPYDTIFYTTSHIKVSGHWTTVDVQFTDSTDTQGNKGVVTASVPVLVAETACQANASGDCITPGGNPPLMLGIGFGRPDHNYQGYLPSLVNNPLLHLPEMESGSMRAGYIITENGIQVGLTGANAGPGFAYTKLARDTSYTTSVNWATPSGKLIVGDRSYTPTTVLMDTGIQYLFAEGPETPDHFGDPNTRIKIDMFGLDDLIGFQYKPSGTSPGVPADTYWDGEADSYSVNTGFHPFYHFNYLFDADGGYLGLQLKAGREEQEGAFLTPLLALFGEIEFTTPLVTDLPVYLTGATTLWTDSSAIFQSGFQGSSPLTIGGPGLVAMQGDSQLPGGTTVNGGVLLLEAVLTGSVDVGPGGIFINNGVVNGSVVSDGQLAGGGLITGSLTHGGVLAPGNSIGTLSVSGNAILAPGSVYRAEIGAPGASDLLAVGGAASIDGAVLELIPTTGFTPTLGAGYTVLTAAGGITGSFVLDDTAFGTAGSAYPFLGAQAESTGTGLSITLTRSAVPFTLFAATPNEMAAAAAADTLPVSSPLTAALVQLTPAEVPGAFDALSGEVHASAKGLFVEQSSLVRNAFTDRLRAAQGGVGASTASVVSYVPAAGGALAYASPTPTSEAGMAFKAVAAPATTEGIALWSTGFGSWGEMNGNANVAGLSDSVGGFLIGADAAMGDGWRLGVAGGYSYTDFDVDGRNSSGQSDNWHVGIYGGNRWGDLALRSGVAYTWQDVSTSRSATFGSFADQLKADYDAGTLQAFGELGWRFDTAFAAVEPYANLAYVRLHTDGYGEQGGAAALIAAGSDMDTSFTTLGLRASKEIVLGSFDATLRGAAGWRHAFGDVTPLATQAFLGSDAFTIAGVPIAEDAAVLEAGLDVLIGAATTLGVAYAGQFGDGVTQNGFNATLKVSF